MLSKHLQAQGTFAGPLPVERMSRGGLPRARQQGVALLIALIVLVIMTLAGIELMRSVDTTNIIAGNLGFQQAATHSGDSAVETAIAWLQQTNTANPTTLQSNVPGVYQACYNPADEPPVSANPNTINWAKWWNTTAGGGSLAGCPNPAGNVFTTAYTATDAAGNQWSYTINRMCSTTGAPVASPTQHCAASPVATASAAGTSDEISGNQSLNASAQVYYRITASIIGPRGTKSFIQAIVAL